MEEPAEVRIGRGQRLIEAVREDLELFGVAELEERIDVLQSEIARVQAQIDRKHLRELIRKYGLDPRQETDGDDG